MKTALAQLESISPYSQSRYYETPKLRGESNRDYEERTWRDRVHADENGMIYMPPMSFKNCFSEAAKFLSIKVPGKGKSTFTKHVEAGILIMDAVTLPIKKEDVDGEWFFVPSDGRRGGGSRVPKCFPVIREWKAEVTVYVLDETVLQTIDVPGVEKEMSALEYHIREAGSFIGLGRFRPRNNGFYGRFRVNSFSCK